MPGTHESCNKIRLSHTSALGGLFIADEYGRMQAGIFMGVEFISLVQGWSRLAVAAGAVTPGFFRPFGACCDVGGLTHGLRRGLRSCAPSELGLGSGSFRNFLA